MAAEWAAECVSFKSSVGAICSRFHWANFAVSLKFHTLQNFHTVGTFHELVDAIIVVKWEMPSLDQPVATIVWATEFSAGAMCNHMVFNSIQYPSPSAGCFLGFNWASAVLRLDLQSHWALDLHAAKQVSQRETTSQSRVPEWAGTHGTAARLSHMRVDAVITVGVALQALLGLLEDVVADAADVKLRRLLKEQLQGISWHGCWRFIRPATGCTSEGFISYEYLWN